MSNKNTIRKAIETIEPESTAKERMLANIKRKATAQEETAEQPKAAKVLRFNRVMKWAIPVAACLVLVVTTVFALPYLMGGRKSAANYDYADPSYDPADAAEIANPWISVKDSSSLKESTGIEIEAPSDAGGVEYNALGDEIADVTFMIDGHEYTLRASKRTDDFSGLYGDAVEDSKSIASADGNASYEVLTSGDEIYRKIAWSDGDTAYILTNTDGASEEEFLKVYESYQ